MSLTGGLHRSEQRSGSAVVWAAIIPDWLLERLAVSSMRSEVICALLGGALNKSLRIL